jgi:hypothetical protein
MVIVLVTETKVRWFKPAEAIILRAIRFNFTNSFGGEVKLRGPHVVRFLRYIKEHC